MKKVRIFLISMAVLSVLVFLPALHTLFLASDERYVSNKEIARCFHLTDFCFSTESRHTRHVALPELIAPFQDLPGFHDHFPSSSFFRPETTRFAPGYQKNSAEAPAQP